MLLKEAKHKDQLLLSANEQIILLSRRLENIGNDFDAICNDDDVLAESKNETSLKQQICVVKKEKKVLNAELKNVRSKNTNVDRSDNAEFEAEIFLDHTNDVLAKSKNETSLKQEICIVKKEKKSRSKNTNADKSDNAEFEVEQILDHTNNIIARKFLIRWKGYDSGHDSWVLQKQLNCPELLADYLKRKNV